VRLGFGCEYTSTGIHQKKRNAGIRVDLKCCLTGLLEPGLAPDVLQHTGMDV
jgi:hypothetical protein